MTEKYTYTDEDNETSVKKVLTSLDNKNHEYSLFNELNKPITPLHLIIFVSGILIIFFSISLLSKIYDDSDTYFHHHHHEHYHRKSLHDEVDNESPIEVHPMTVPQQYNPYYNSKSVENTPNNNNKTMLTARPSIVPS